MTDKEIKILANNASDIIVCCLYIIETKVNKDTCRKMTHTGAVNYGFTAHQYMKLTQGLATKVYLSTAFLWLLPHSSCHRNRCS